MQDSSRFSTQDSFLYKEWALLVVSNAIWLTNAPDTFIRTMNNLFSDLLDRGIVAFMDDVLIYSYTMEEHELLLKAVFNRLKEE